MLNLEQVERELDFTGLDRLRRIPTRCFQQKNYQLYLKKGDYDFISQFDEVVSMYESPYYEDRYWFKKDKFQRLKKMKDFLELAYVHILLNITAIIGKIILCYLF